MYYDLLDLDKSLDKERLREFQLASEDCFPFDDYPDLWYLESLAVHPACQRRGVGKTLVAWGMSQAAAEDSIVGVESSFEGNGLFDSLDFVSVRQVQGFDKGIVHAMVWEMDMIL
jgi:ribosomal protein S18 acetylase RimI-like enzyme